MTLKTNDPNSFFLFDPIRAEWIALFDGFTMGQARQGAKFAVEFEQSHNHCKFRLNPEGVTFVDLGSPGGTLLNEETTILSDEIALQENDQLRINGREFFLTHGRVRPVPRAPKAAPPAPESPPEASPSNPVRRSKAIPVNGVRGSSVGAGVGAGPSARDRLFKIIEVFGVMANAGWDTTARIALGFNRFREPILAAMIAVALITWKLHAIGTVPQEVPHQPLTASQEQLPQTTLDFIPAALPTSPLESIAKDSRAALPPPSAPSPGSHVFMQLKTTPPFKAVTIEAPPIAKIAHQSTYTKTPLNALPGKAEGVATKSFDPPKQPMPPTPAKPVVTFEVVGAAPEQAFPEQATPTNNSAPAPTNDSEPTRYGITAISVMTSEAHKTRFEGYVSADTVVSGFRSMNSGNYAGSARAPASTSAQPQHFDAPTLNRDGKSYRLDWCYRWEDSCGKPAADAYCREMGMSAATNYAMASKVGSSDQPTAIIGEAGVLCPGAHPGHPCDGFAYIECQK